MANLYITQFKRLARDEKGNTVPVGEVPSVSGEVLVFTSAATSAPFSKSARFIRLLADADCYLAFGSGNATATSGLKIEANVAEYFGLNEQDVRGGLMTLSAYDGSS